MTLWHLQRNYNFFMAPTFLPPNPSRIYINFFVQSVWVLVNLIVMHFRIYPGNLHNFLCGLVWKLELQLLGVMSYVEDSFCIWKWPCCINATYRRGVSQDTLQIWITVLMQVGVGNDDMCYCVFVVEPSEVWEPAHSFFLLLSSLKIIQFCVSVKHDLKS